MTRTFFRKCFPEIEDLAEIQTYDDHDSLDIAISTFRSKILSITDPGKLADALNEEVTALDTIVSKLVSEIIPNVDETEEVHYIIFDRSHLPVSEGDLIARLRVGAQTPEVYFRLAYSTLETNAQAVLDCLTSDRINEELDAPTFVERLRGAFRRTKSSVVSIGPSLERLRDTSDRIHGRIQLVRKVINFIQSDVSPALLNTDVETARLDAEIERLSQFTSNSQAFAAHFQKFMEIAANGVSRIEKDVCSDANIAGAEGESILVSREAERHALFRPAPIVWAIFITFIAKIVLAHNVSESLHGLTIPILLFTALLTWLTSIFFGVWGRKRRMQDLQRHVRQQFRQVLQDEANKEELIEFPSIYAGQSVQDAKPIRAYGYRGKIMFHRTRVALLNLWALAIPLMLLVFVLIARSPDEQRFVARFDGSGPCILAEGRLVFVSRGSFFVLSEDPTRTFWGKSLERAFPEFLADVVPREHVISVKDASASPKMRDCTTADPDRNSYTVTHAGNALGAWGQENNAQALALGIESLLASFKAETPVQIDIENTLPADSGLTIELGDASLNVLANAIGASEPIGTFHWDPQIVAARNVITLELSKTDIENIDLEIVFDALNDIGQAAGRIVTIEQALSLAFAGLNTSPTETAWPPSVLAMFEGDETLLSEIRALRLASETSNGLVQSYIGLSETNTEVADRLSNQLTMIVEGQKDLLATIGAARTDAIVVAPSILTATKLSEPTITNTNIFQTSISLQDDTAEIENLGNTLVLPVFSEPVQNGSGRLNTAEGAFDWGSDVTKLRDPMVLDDGTTYFDRIAQTIEACLIGGATVEIDVLGLASRSWSGTTNAAQNAVLNYNLAEGRRVGALRKIASGMTDQAALGRILVQTSNGNLPLSVMLERLDAAPTASDALRHLGRFDGIEAFENRRDTLLAVTGLSEENVSPLEELFARSVVLRMIRSEGGPCAF